MGIISIDQEKCTKEGRCVQACPVGILRWEENEDFPTEVNNAQKSCIKCGHCVAICPNGALTHRQIAPEDCLPVREDMVFNAASAEYFLRSRRSIRNYRQKPVEKHILQKVIGVAAHAPSGHNRQPVHWTIIYKQEEVLRLSELVVDWMRDVWDSQPELAKDMSLKWVFRAIDRGMNPICRGAPHLVLAHARENVRTGFASSVIALTYLELAAPSFGLGACWAGFFNAAALSWPPLQEAIGLPEGHLCYGSMLFGYPKYRYFRIPPRNAPRIDWRE